MAYRYNGTGVKAGSNFEPAPKGKYLLLIVDAKEGHTKTNGDYKVTVEYKIHAGPLAGKRIKFHNVVFLPPEHQAAGISLHYLKSIGEPFEGEFEIEPDRWLGKLVWGEVVVNQKGYNEVKAVEKFTEGETDGPVKHDEAPTDAIEPPLEDELPY